MNNYFQIGIHTLCFFLAYKTGKYFGFCNGLKYFNKNGIQRSHDNCSHYCNVTLCNVVCFEIEKDLWVKEYCGPGEISEGKTYMVYYCPWCGYQSERSKIREKVKQQINDIVK